MQTRILGNGLAVSALGYGCMGLSHAYGAPLEDEQSIRMIRLAYDLGYTFFDTAEAYGTQADPHANEKLVGRALSDLRGKVRIASKFGVRFGGGAGQLMLDSRPEVIRASLEGSLKRLKLDHIDLYYQHRIDPRVEPEEVAQLMDSLIREGKILHWGISEATEQYLRRAHAVCPVSAVQNRYSMMARGHEALFDTLEELGIGLVAFSPLANGYLTGKYGREAQFDSGLDYRAAMPQFKPGAEASNRPLLELLAGLAERFNASPAQISLAWMMSKKPWIVPIPGTRDPGRLKENADAAQVRLSATDVRSIDHALDQMEMSDVFGVSR